MIEGKQDEIVGICREFGDMVDGAHLSLIWKGLSGGVGGFSVKG